MSFKKGDIIENTWAGLPESRFFIYEGVKGRFVKGIEHMNGLKTVEYHKLDMNANHIDGKPAFIKVGHTDAFDIMKKDLKEHQDIYRSGKDEVD